MTGRYEYQQALEEAMSRLTAVTVSRESDAVWLDCQFALRQFSAWDSTWSIADLEGYINAAEGQIYCELLDDLWGIHD